MRWMNPETGIVYTDELNLVVDFCDRKSCMECPLDALWSKHKTLNCVNIVEDYPEEALKVIGFIDLDRQEDVVIENMEDLI